MERGARSKGGQEHKVQDHIRRGLLGGMLWTDRAPYVVTGVSTEQSAADYVPTVALLCMR